MNAAGGGGRAVEQCFLLLDNGDSINEIKKAKSENSFMDEFITYLIESEKMVSFQGSQKLDLKFWRKVRDRHAECRASATAFSCLYGGNAHGGPAVFKSDTLNPNPFQVMQWGLVGGQDGGHEGVSG